MLYEVVVTEMRAADVRYVVDAEDGDSAVRKAAIGDTVEEDALGRYEVTDRFVSGDPQPLTPSA